MKGVDTPELILKYLQFFYFINFLLGFDQTFVVISSKLALLQKRLCNVNKTYRHLISRPSVLLYIRAIQYPIPTTLRFALISHTM